MPFGSADPQAALSLVGRDEELGELRRGLADAIEGRGGLFLLTGRAGIGKTRLVEELIELAAADDVRAAWGRCWEGGGASAYWP